MSDERIDTKSFEHLIHEKAVDHTVLYAKANQLGAELYSDLPIEERRQKIESEVSQLSIWVNFYFSILSFCLHRYFDYNKKLIYKIKSAMKWFLNIITSKPMKLRKEIFDQELIILMKKYKHSVGSLYHIIKQEQNKTKLIFFSSCIDNSLLFW